MTFADCNNLALRFCAAIFMFSTPAWSQNVHGQLLEALEIATKVGESHSLDQQIQSLEDVKSQFQEILFNHPNSATSRWILGLDELENIAPLIRVERMLIGLKKLPITAPVMTTISPTESCRFKPQILEMARGIIDLRSDIPGFGAANFGTDAAYLILHYGEMTTDEGLALLNEIKLVGRRPPRNLDVLETAFAVSRLGADDGMSVNGDDPHVTFANTYWGGLRSVILADGGKSFFKFLHEVRENEELKETFEQQYLRGHRVALVILDQTDDYKLDFARLAEANGEIALTGFILASRTNLEEYTRFLGRYSDDDFIQAFAGEEAVFSMGLTLFSNSTPTELRRRLTSAERVQKQVLFDIYKAGLLNREMDVLNITYNQTGRDEVVIAARGYLSALAAGQIMPEHDAEAAWLFIHQALIEALGKRTAIQALSTFNISSRHRHFSGSALETMNWVVAKDALTEYMSAGAEILPPRSALLSDDFDWDSWLRVAKVILSSNNLSDILNEAEAKIAVELLYLRGDIDGSINLASIAFEPRQTAKIYRDMIKRLDLRCAAHTAYPGKAVLLGGATMYRFPPAH